VIFFERKFEFLFREAGLIRWKCWR